MDKQAEILFENWRKRNISGMYCKSGALAKAAVLEMIPKEASVGFSGSKTLEEVEVITALAARGNKVFDPYKAGISWEESLKIRKEATLADYYLASANAISQNGEMVFFSGYGNRTSGVAYAKNVIIVCGINKITANIQEAMTRAREFATPLNCKRLGWESACLKDGRCHDEICKFPEYKRMCCQILIIEAEVSPGRLRVILVGENLGY
ncbi:MAG: lactate utilization protein [Candidatus Omnitrophica bacterium]|nr:lactate utilization protein [Candidatus Omnitrophota bacterium]